MYIVHQYSIIFKNPLNLGLSKRNIFNTICVGRVFIGIRYFLFEKQAFNGLLKVVDIHTYKISFIITN